MQPIESNNYADILLNSSGLLDVRAPIEYKQGAFPGSENHPLLNDEERHQVGICYKNNGQEQAIEYGHKLVQGEIKLQRVDKWVNYASRHPNPYLYCFRGGLRSRITQEWLHDAGIDIPRVKGGYKALRHFLVSQLDDCTNTFNFILLGGFTGCRKTHLIKQLKHGIDLEGAAHHRGSSFGAHATAQSSQINFENQVAIDFLHANKNNFQTIALEDESRFIGSVDIPKNLYSEMRTSPLVVVESRLETRLQQLLKEYIIDMESEFTSIHKDPETAFQYFSQNLQSSLDRISKRLGPARWKTISSNMQKALTDHKSRRDTESHLQWLAPLLNEYYDPMYASQLAKRTDNIVFTGDYTECYEFLNEYNALNT